MKQYSAKNIRNIVLAGHSGSGKSSLAEAMLYLTKATDRLGKISDGNTVMDFDPEEIKRKVSVSTAVAPIEWKDTKINIIDISGSRRKSSTTQLSSATSGTRHPTTRKTLLPCSK